MEQVADHRDSGSLTLTDAAYLAGAPMLCVSITESATTWIAREFIFDRMILGMIWLGVLPWLGMILLTSVSVGPVALHLRKLALPGLAIGLLLTHFVLTYVSGALSWSGYPGNLFDRSIVSTWFVLIGSITIGTGVALVFRNGLIKRRQVLLWGLWLIAAIATFNDARTGVWGGEFEPNKRIWAVLTLGAGWAVAFWVDRYHERHA
ncbi:MAG TPA: hypothetical protein PLH94_06165 [Fimbriimonadaceae bacterium]|nr:hypothetical protein [Fimbriimonadaceae bacterium]